MLTGARQFHHIVYQSDEVLLFAHLLASLSY